MRNLCLDKFAAIASSSDEDRWNDLVRVISDSNFQLKISELSNIL